MSGASRLPGPDDPTISRLIYALSALAVYRRIDTSCQDWRSRESQLYALRYQLLDAVAMSRLNNLNGASHAKTIDDRDTPATAKIKAKLGRKEKTYQSELARICCKVWAEHKPDSARGRPAFIHTVFEAAGMPLSVKRLEELAASVAPTHTNHTMKRLN